MTEAVNLHEAKTHFSRLVDRAHAGEEIVIAKAGRPYARLVPLADPPKRELGFLPGHLDDSFFDPLPEDELLGWE
jgi:prevent-host-death family protein